MRDHMIDRRRLVAGLWSGFSVARSQQGDHNHQQQRTNASNPNVSRCRAGAEPLVAPINCLMVFIDRLDELSLGG